ETANQNLHRRSFIKTSAALAGVTLLSQWSLAGAYAAGSDVIKVAVVGCGGRGTGAAFDAIATGANIQIVALADAFLDRLEEAYSKLMERHPDKMAVTTETKFVGFDAYKHAIDLADVVILATSP